MKRAVQGAWAYKKDEAADGATFEGFGEI